LASSLNSDNGVVSGSSGLKSSADASGVLELQTNGTAALSINTSQVVSTTNGVTLQGLTVGRGAGAVSTNTAVGASAMANMTSSGFFDVAIGYNALYTSTGGIANNAIGYRAMYATTTGANSQALGASALAANTTGSFLVAVGDSALAANTTGNNSVAIGQSALANNTTASNNTAVGYQAGYTNTTGNGTFIGYQAGLATNGQAQTFVGKSAGSGNTGNYNVALGGDCFAAAGAGSENVAVGFQAMASNTSGNYNVAMGRQALTTNTTSSGNTAIGYQAAANGTGDGTTALGYRAAYGLTTGYGNTAVGSSAMFSSTSLRHSTGIGYEALKNATTGVGNTMIQPYSSTETYQPAFNITTESNRISMGSTTVSNAYIQVSWTVVSDARDKMNFAPVTHGLDFVSQLNPVSYQFKETRESNVPHGPVRYGFKAQEILALEGDNPVIIDNEDSEKLRYNGESLVPVLVKAIQELKAEVDSLKSQLKGA